MTTIRSPRAYAALGALALVLTVGVGTVAAAGPHGAGGGAAAARGAGAQVARGTGTTVARGRGAHVPVTVTSGTLTSAQAASLAGMANEEKLARDLYAAFAAQYPSVVWDNIGAAEATHLTAIRTLLTRYGITDPTASLPAGSFASPDTAALYATLLAQGSVSETAAFGVGRSVELDDIAKLDAAKAGVTATDVLRVYGNLRTGSTQHLAAFSRLIAL